jgi:uncharacterized OsmC-like protein
MSEVGMTEKIVFRQASTYETEVRTPVLEDQAQADQLQPVTEWVELNPYEMLLVGLAGCTTAVLFTYAQYHQLELHEIEITATYDRIFEEDCENCEHIESFEEIIEEQIMLIGDLSQEQREKLFQISHHCPIQKMLESGIGVSSKLVE